MTPEAKPTIAPPTAKPTPSLDSFLGSVSDLIDICDVLDIDFGTTAGYASATLAKVKSGLEAIRAAQTIRHRV